MRRIIYNKIAFTVALLLLLINNSVTVQ